MKVQIQFLIASLLVLTGLVVCCPSNSFAQGKKLPGSTPAPKPKAPSGPRSPGPPKIIKERFEVKIGSLGVTTEPGATVVLIPKAGKRLQKTADETGAVIFDSPGRGVYRLEVAKPDFETRSESVDVKPSQVNVRKMDLKPVTYKLNVKTSLSRGSIRYARREEGSTVAMGSPGAVPSNYCVLAIRPNGEVIISDLRRGQYDINILPDSPEFDVKSLSITVPQDTTDPDDPSGIKVVSVQLDSRKSTETFSANAWSDADWVKPNSWKVEKGIKVRNTEGIALPANDRYRHYIDFELIANVKLNNDGAVGFALRAKNEKNGYLLLLSGPKSNDGPNTAKLYLLKDGERRYLNSRSLSAFSSIISSDKGFQMRILGERSGFTLFIEDSDGNLQKAGQLPDDLNTYPIGAVGIAAIDKPDFDVRQFQVCTPRCQ